LQSNIPGVIMQKIVDKFLQMLYYQIIINEEVSHV